MSNIVTAKVKVKGTRPLFQHKFGRDALPLEKQEKTGVAGNDPEEWRRTCMVTKDGQLYVEPTYVFATIREAGRFHKIGRASAIKPIQATLQVAEHRILFDRYWPEFPNGEKFDPTTADPPIEDDEEPVYLDVRGVKNPNSSGRNIRYRIAASPGWETEFTLIWDKTIVPTAMMESLVIDAGRLVGIGNGRAIGMGRFDLVSFELE